MALSLVGGRVAAVSKGVQRIAALASIVDRDDASTAPRPLGWIVWDEALQPWVAVSSHSPADLQGLVPATPQRTISPKNGIRYAPLVGALPARYVIVRAER